MAIDRRTTVGKALATWRSELLADVGGIGVVSMQELAEWRASAAATICKTHLHVVGLQDVTLRKRAEQRAWLRLILGGGCEGAMTEQIGP